MLLPLYWFGLCIVPEQNECLYCQIPPDYYNPELRLVLYDPSVLDFIDKGILDAIIVTTENNISYPIKNMEFVYRHHDFASGEDRDILSFLQKSTPDAIAISCKFIPSDVPVDVLKEYLNSIGICEDTKFIEENMLEGLLTTSQLALQSQVG